jgi:2-hydroxymuconate-semialdehyde hydrolase
MTEHEHQFRGMTVHHVETGQPGSPALLMLHGSGAGASTLGNWRKVLEPLGEHFHVHAMDLIGFGESQRKPAPPYFDYELWMAQCRDMLARVPGDRVGVIGHSLSGSFALRLAGSEARVHKVMTTATLGAPFRANASTLATWSFPGNRDELKTAARRLIHDESLIDETYLSHREALLFSGDYKDYFTKMFAGDRQRFIDQATLSTDEVSAIDCDVLMVHGREDVGYPAESLTLELGRAIAHADVVLLGRCSHSVAFEQPEKFLSLAKTFFA